MINYKKDDRWLITIDLDGTFLNSPPENSHSNMDFNPKNLEVVNKLIDKGHKVAIVTGRPWKDVETIYNSIGLKSIIANYNGAHIHYPGNHDQFATLNYSINRKILTEVLKEPLLKEAANCIVIECKEQTFATNTETDLFRFITQNKTINLVHWDGESDIDEPPMSTLVGIDKDKVEDMNMILQTLNRKYGAAMFFRFWDFKFDDKTWTMMEINQKTSNKGSAMKHIAEFYNIPLSRTIAFGDGLNDREMLIEAAVGVAMKNAKGTVKTYADDTTDFTNDEAGVGLYLEEFFSV